MLRPKLDSESPILNTRVEESVKAAWQLCCDRQGVKPGVRLRELVEREILAERALDVVRTVGFAEAMRRLALPTYPTHAGYPTQPEIAPQGKLRHTPTAL